MTYIGISLVKDKMQDKILECKNMKEAFEIIESYPLIGDFMAYQLVTDINYSDVVDWKENEFAVAGPGSLRGINKCFIDKGNMSNEDIIKYMYENQDKEFKRLNLNFKRYVSTKMEGGIVAKKELIVIYN